MYISVHGTSAKVPQFRVFLSRLLRSLAFETGTQVSVIRKHSDVLFTVSPQASVEEIKDQLKNQTIYEENTELVIYISISVEDEFGKIAKAYVIAEYLISLGHLVSFVCKQHQVDPQDKPTFATLINACK